MPRRRAFTLIELVTAITILSALMALAMGLLHLVFRVEERCREAENRQRMLGSLAQQFREDVHAAGAWTPEPAQARWQFVLGPEHEVVYRRESERLLRLETVAGRLRRQESYAVPAEVRLECLADAAPDSASPRLLTLRLASEPGAASEPIWKECRIEACLGLDHRLPVVPAQEGGRR